jgi:hypothetical protein
MIIRALLLLLSIWWESAGSDTPLRHHACGGKPLIDERKSKEMHKKHTKER